jgi:hypothetical protein
MALYLGKCRLVQKTVSIAMPHSILPFSDLRKELAKFYEKLSREGYGLACPALSRR